MQIIKSELQNFLSTEDIISDPIKINPYLKEKRNNFKSEALLVVTPKNTTEVSKVVEYCNKVNLPIVPLSGNTGLVGGGVSTNKQIILSLKKLTKVRDFDSINQTVTLEAGISLKQAIDICFKKNLLFPLNLPSKKEALIGGNLATNAGGISTLKYGQIKNFTLGLEVVLSNGHIISDLNKLTKRNIGPDYKNLFIGSEGILGIITAGTFKLYSLPKQTVNILLGFLDINQVIEAFTIFKETFSVQISAFELMNNNSVNVSLNIFKDSFFPIKRNIPWYVLITVDFNNNSYSNVEYIQALLKKLYNSNTILDSYIENNLNNLWDVRNLISDAQKSYKSNIKHDIAIPLSNMAEFISNATKEIYNISTSALPVIFGHIGDQSLHFNFISKTRESIDSNNLLNCKKDINQLILDLVIKYGGNFSAEHGIGLLHQEKLKKYYFNNQFYMLKMLKSCLDPKNIFNPNKVIKLS